MKIVAKNQKVFLTKSWPMTPSRNSKRLSTSHSRKFWAPVGTSFILRVAICAKTIKPSATTQETIIELVMGNSPMTGNLGDHTSTA